MTCEHTSLVQSTTYPVGTRCARCGASAESIVSSCRSQLIAMRAELNEALSNAARVAELETIAGQAQRELEREQLSSAHYDKELAETKEQLSQQLVQTKSLSEENIRLRKQLEAFDNQLRAALTREEELQRKLDVIERRPAPVTSIKK
jgi:uncharacterized protein YciW